MGEAKVPGPLSAIRFAVINPTSVRDKDHQWSTLANQEGCDILSLSETCATRETQLELPSSLRKHGYKACWSDPVMPLTDRKSVV